LNDGCERVGCVTIDCNNVEQWNQTVAVVTSLGRHHAQQVCVVLM
jgi:hypothetical protein